MLKQKISLLTLLILTSTAIRAQVDFKLDPIHTLIQFNVERFMVGEVTGAFTEYNGAVILNSDKEVQSVNVTIAVQSLDSNNETRDGHLKGPRWLDAATFPEITFTSTRFYQEGSKNYVEGDLTIKGVTKSVRFPFEMKGPFKDPTGSVTVGLVGDLTINRQDYGINFSKTMDNGALFIGDDVIIKIRALAIAEK